MSRSSFVSGTNNDQSAPLNESSLPLTYRAPDGSGYSTIRFGSAGSLAYGTANGSDEILWNGDPNFVPAKSCTANITESTHTSFDEWANIVFDIRGTDFFFDGIRPDSELFKETLTSETVKELRDEEINSINDEIQDLPDESFAKRLTE